VLINSLDEKACFSQVGRKHKYDYSVTFADSQKLQLLRQKLLRTISILDSCLGVVKGCQTCCVESDSLNPTFSSTAIYAEFQTYAEQIRYHRANATSILEYLLGDCQTG